MKYDISSLNAYFHLDGLSVLMISMTGVLFGLLFFLTREPKEKSGFHTPIIFGLLLAFVTAFSTCHALLFFIAYEISVIGLSLHLLLYGGPLRKQATVSFFLYHIIGSFLFLTAILYLYTKCHRFFLLDLYQVPLSSTERLWVSIWFIAGFAFQLPLFPLHRWLADAHTEASLKGSILLAGILLKLTAYGVIRFALPFEWSPSSLADGILLGMVGAGILYGSMALCHETHAKRFVALCSLNSMATIFLGTLLCLRASSEIRPMAHQGLVLLMLAHTFSITGLFVMIQALAKRLGTYSIENVSGLQKQYPALSFFVFVFLLCQMGIPGSLNFLAEWNLLVASLSIPSSPHFEGLVRGGYPVLILIGWFFSTIYSLSFYQRIFWGTPSLEPNPPTHDLSFRERVIGICLMGLLIGLGCAPNILIRCIV